MEQLKAYLAAQSMRPAHFAQALGVSRATVKKWLDGARVPSDAFKEQIHVETRGAVPVSAWFRADLP